MEASQQPAEQPPKPPEQKPEDKPEGGTITGDPGFHEGNTPKDDD